MTTYYSIDEMPEEIREQQAVRLSDIFFEGKQDLMKALNFIQSLDKGGGDLHFIRAVGYEDKFFTTLDIKLPYFVSTRLRETLSDLAIITTAIANHSIKLGYTQPDNNTGEK
jgi:hypothetical protein